MLAAAATDSKSSRLNKKPLDKDATRIHTHFSRRISPFPNFLIIGATGQKTHRHLVIYYSSDLRVPHNQKKTHISEHTSTVIVFHNIIL